jgi:hypothetical protein
VRMQFRRHVHALGKASAVVHDTWILLMTQSCVVSRVQANLRCVSLKSVFVSVFGGLFPRRSVGSCIAFPCTMVYYGSNYPVVEYWRPIEGPMTVVSLNRLGRFCIVGLDCSDSMVLSSMLGFCVITDGILKCSLGVWMMYLQS